MAGVQQVLSELACAAGVSFIPFLLCPVPGCIRSLQRQQQVSLLYIEQVTSPQLAASWITNVSIKTEIAGQACFSIRTNAQ